jgi:hypothetical protein
MKLWQRFPSAVKKVKMIVDVNLSASLMTERRSLLPSRVIPHPLSLVQLHYCLLPDEDPQRYKYTCWRPEEPSAIANGTI